MEEFYASFLKYTQSVFTGVKGAGVLDIDSIAEKIKILRNEARHNSRFLLRGLPRVEPADNENYLASHTARSAVVAVVIGRYLRLPDGSLTELGIAALLHGIGMLKTPEACLKEPEQEERFLSHPARGYTLLRDLKCPDAVSLAALEHHEREDGSGYPRNLKGGAISLYGKITAAACSYETLSAKDQDAGITELLKNEEKQYDSSVVKALAAPLLSF